MYISPFCLQTLLPGFGSYSPAGASTKLFRHFAQIIKSGYHLPYHFSFWDFKRNYDWKILFIFSTGNFQQFDYGPNVNIEKYNSEVPMKYDLAKVTAPVHLYYGDGDYLVSREVRMWIVSLLIEILKSIRILQTAHALEKQLRNCTGLTRVPFHNFNHLDFLFAYDAKSLLYDQVIAAMDEYKWELINYVTQQICPYIT